MSTTGTQTATITRVATSTAFAILLAAGSNRRMVHIQNESAVVMYVKFGNTATATDYTFQMAAGAYYESPPGFPYSGLITGILASSTGFAQVTTY